MSNDYTDVDKVNRILGPHAVSDTTPVTRESAELLVKAVQSEIDTELAMLGVTSALPFATVSPFRTYLGAIASWGVAAQILKASFPEATGPGESPAYAYWEKKYQEALEEVTEEDAIKVLIGLGATTYLSAQASGYFTRYGDDEAVVGNLAGASLFVVDDLKEHPW